MEHWGTLLRTCAPWRHRNTSIDILLKWNLENITPDLCTSLKTQEHINRYPIEVEHQRTSLRTCAHLWSYRNTSINIQLKWNMENVTPDLCTPLERQEHICWYPIEVKPWRTSLWICVHVWRHENKFIDIVTLVRSVTRLGLLGGDVPASFLLGPWQQQGICIHLSNHRGLGRFTRWEVSHLEEERVELIS